MESFVASEDTNPAALTVLFILLQHGTRAPSTESVKQFVGSVRDQRVERWCRGG